MALSRASSALVDDVISNHTAIDYELAGRLPSQTFKDLRSASKARRRQRANREKYWSYRSVNAGQVGRQHHELTWGRCNELPADAPMVTMTEQGLYREAQRYPRPPAVHRRPRHYDNWPKTCRKDRERHEQRHTTKRLRDDAEDCLDPWFMSYVAGYANRLQDLDDHIFRRCDYCWAELNSFYVDDEMFDCIGNAVGQLSHRWEVEIGDIGAGDRLGFAGRSRVGALFLMSEEDWRHFIPSPWIRGAEWNDSGIAWEDQWSEESLAEDNSESHNHALSEMTSWADLHLRNVGCFEMEDEWDVVSSCSSWSHVSGQSDVYRASLQS